MDDWHDVSDEKERTQAKRSYHEAQMHVPEDGLPDDFGEVEAAITVGIDDDDNFHIIGNAPEDKQDLVSSAAVVIRDVLSSYSDYREHFTKNSQKEGDTAER